MRVHIHSRLCVKLQQILLLSHLHCLLRSALYFSFHLCTFRFFSFVFSSPWPLLIPLLLSSLFSLSSFAPSHTFLWWRVCLRVTWAVAAWRNVAPQVWCSARTRQLSTGLCLWVFQFCSRLFRLCCCYSLLVVTFVAFCCSYYRCL